MARNLMPNAEAGGGVVSPVEAGEAHQEGERESVGGVGGAGGEGQHLQGAVTTGEEEVGTGGAAATA